MVRTEWGPQTTKTRRCGDGRWRTPQTQKEEGCGKFQISWTIPEVTRDGDTGTVSEGVWLPSTDLDGLWDPDSRNMRWVLLHHFTMTGFFVWSRLLSDRQSPVLRSRDGDPPYWETVLRCLRVSRVTLRVDGSPHLSNSWVGKDRGGRNRVPDDGPLGFGSVGGHPQGTLGWKGSFGRE